METIWFGATPLHLIAFPVLFIINQFFAVVAPSRIEGDRRIVMWVLNFVLAFFLCTLMPFLLVIFFSLKFDFLRSALVASLICLPFYFVQDVFFLAKQLKIKKLPARLVLPMIAAVDILLIRFSIGAETEIRLLTSYLNLCSLFLLAACGIALIISFNRFRPKFCSDYLVTCDLTSNKADIYLLILDSYTSNKSLRDYFKFDNKDFTRQLESLGFSVLDHINSTYTRTSASIASTLNLGRTFSLGNYFVENGYRECIRKNEVVRILEANGYDIHNFSLFDVGAKLRYYSLGLNSRVKMINDISKCSAFNMFYALFMKLRIFGINARILAKAVELSSKETIHPKFFYGHIMAPHPPFVIDSSGCEIDFVQLRNNKFNVTGYINQTRGISVMVARAVNKIVQNDPNSIIIVMGDHGYGLLQGPNQEFESKSSFLAYYGPAKNDIYQMAKSNDIFRVILN